MLQKNLVGIWAYLVQPSRGFCNWAIILVVIRKPKTFRNLVVKYQYGERYESAIIVYNSSPTLLYSKPFWLEKIELGLIKIKHIM